MMVKQEACTNLNVLNLMEDEVTVNLRRLISSNSDKEYYMPITIMLPHKTGSTVQSNCLRWKRTSKFRDADAVLP
jgi:hypothetical protein